MPIIFKTEKISIHRYYDVLRRCVMLNSGYRAWKRLKDKFTIYVIPLSKAEEYKSFYEHLKIEGAGGMAWGITGKNVLYWFVSDSRNPFIFRQNMGPGFHEILHALLQNEVGTSHVTYLTRGNPYGAPNMKGKSGAFATVAVHDEWYVMKTKIRVWFRNGFWIPAKMPYMPVWRMKLRYNIT